MAFNREDRQWLIDSMPNVISTEENEELIQLVTKEEVCRSIFSMNAYKSLGPNGFSLTFFQHLWDIIKVELVREMHEFFRNGKLLKGINKNS